VSSKGRHFCIGRMIASTERRLGFSGEAPLAGLNGQEWLRRYMETLREQLRAIAARSESRVNLWVEFINSFSLRQAAEIGVYRGDFARALMQGCTGLTRYYMVDPWKHLTDWNKPANHPDAELEAYYQETMAKTDFASAKRLVLRGKTVEVIESIPDEALDFAYIDGDHTLRGITVDLISLYPKVRTGGFLCGDDFCSSIWEHRSTFEPTLVFPFAVHFAEAVGATIFALPYSQFCLQKTGQRHFSFVDLTGNYSDTALLNQVAPHKLFKLAMAERFPGTMGLLRRAKAVLSR